MLGHVHADPGVDNGGHRRERNAHPVYGSVSRPPKHAHQDISAGASPVEEGAVKLNLRTKGIVAFLALAAYISGFGLIQAQQRQTLLRMAGELEQIYDEEDALDKASYAVAHVVLKLEDAFYSAPLGSSTVESIALDVELIQAGLQGLQTYHVSFADDIARLDREMVSLRGQPSRSNMLALRETERDLNQRLDKRTRQARARRAALWTAYRATHDTITVIAVSMGLLGAVVFGAVITLFLTRLTWDLRKLSVRALEIVTGYRGIPLDVTRHDEVGNLMEAVNQMQMELRHREQQLEISREQRFHQEKMAAIGSLAAAVAHEINNPIASIAGIAHSMCDPRVLSGPDAGDASRRLGELILEQTRRIGIISNQIAELTTAHPLEPELLDLNVLVQNTCSFIRYDRRMRNVGLELDLDRNIRAVKAIADHVTQVLINLLINAADAVDGLAGRRPEIRVQTCAAESEVRMLVSDNGHGMDQTVLARAFEEGYTTKPAEKGRGLGLFLCKALIEAGGGRIELESAPGVGTTALVTLPLPQRVKG